MCESTVFLKSENEEIIKDVVRIQFTGGKIICTSLLGEKKVIEGGQIEDIDFLNHTVKIKKQ